MISVCNIIPQKTDTHRTRLTAGGILIDYPGYVSTTTSDLTTMRLHVNSAIPDVKSSYMCMDVKYFYLNNMMDRTEYIMIQIAMTPPKFVEKFNLQEKSHNVYIYERVTKGMYGLPQEGRTAHDALVKHTETYGYHPSSKTPGLWTHTSQPINFTLVVDYFGVNDSLKEHSLHLKESLEYKYKVTTYWEGKLYIRIALRWSY